MIRENERVPLLWLQNIARLCPFTATEKIGNKSTYAGTAALSSIIGMVFGAGFFVQGDHRMLSWNRTDPSKSVLRVLISLLSSCGFLFLWEHFYARLGNS